MVAVAAFLGSKLLMRQSQFRLVPARLEFQRHEHFRRLDFAEVIAAAVLLELPGEDQALGRFHFARRSDSRPGFTGSAAEVRLRGNALAGAIDDCELSFESGEKLRGRFLVTRLDYAGDFNGERTYTLSLESSGAVVAS